MIQVEIAPGHWLGPAAAASWQRMLAAGMPRGGITEAGRTRARQEYLYAQYLAGRLVAYAARPGTSKHEGGRAVDMVTSSAAHAWLITHGRAHGWTRPLLRAAKPEPWHWEHSITIDQHLTADTTPVTPIEEDDMTPDQARMLAEVHAALGAGGAVGMDERTTVLGVVRRIEAAVNGLPTALAGISAETSGVPTVLSDLTALVRELAGVVYAGTPGTPVPSTIYQRLARIEQGHA